MTTNYTKENLKSCSVRRSIDQGASLSITVRGSCSRGESTRAGHECRGSLCPLGDRLAADYDSLFRSHSRNAEVKLNPISNDLVVSLESAISGDLFTNLLQKIHY